MQNLHSSARTAAKTKFKSCGLTTSAKIATILMLAAGLVIGCNDEYKIPEKIKPKYTSTNRVFGIIEIDSCEYIVYEAGQEYSMFSHKGNCKYCLARKK